MSHEGIRFVSAEEASREDGAKLTGLAACGLGTANSGCVEEAVFFPWQVTGGATPHDVVFALDHKVSPTATVFDPSSLTATSMMTGVSVVMSSRNVAAVGDHHLAGHEARRIRRQKQGGTDHFSGLGHAFHEVHFRRPLGQFDPLGPADRGTSPLTDAPG